MVQCRRGLVHAHGQGDRRRIRVGTNEPPPPTNQTVVTIEAVDSVTSEQDPRLGIRTDPALLLVRRHGPTNIALNVFYRVSGSASNGVDYEKLSGEVNIPVGATTAEIFVEAIDDSLVEGTESVILNVIPPVCPAIYPPPPEYYTVGRPDTAIAYIRDNDAPPSNSPPTVRITAPPTGSMFREGSDIKIEAVTVDRDGYAPMVEFFANDRKIGEQIINFIMAPPDGTPIEFSFTWSNVAAGSYTLTARATDEEFASAPMSHHPRPIKLWSLLKPWIQSPASRIRAWAFGLIRLCCWSGGTAPRTLPSTCSIASAVRPRTGSITRSFPGK